MRKKLLPGIILGLGLAAALFILFTQQSQRVSADDNPGTNISSSATGSMAWSDVSGWWDFHKTHTVTVGTSSLTGYASSSIGEISLDCATSPSGNVCGTSNYQVTNPEGSGNLSGCAWNDTIGWISFWCGDTNCDGSGTPDPGSCTNSTYRVKIDASGIFSDYAWNDVEGWISFNCADVPNPPSCSDSDYKVETSWRPGSLTGTLDSSVFDTQVTPGATLNSIIWQGSRPAAAGIDVKFQIAVSNNPSGPWNYWGPDAACDGSGDTGTYFGSGVGPDTPIVISGCDRTWISNKRYLRYRVVLQSNTAQDQTPRIDDITLNWSR